MYSLATIAECMVSISLLGRRLGQTHRTLPVPMWVQGVLRVAKETRFPYDHNYCSDCCVVIVAIIWKPSLRRGFMSSSINTPLLSSFKVQKNALIFLGEAFTVYVKTFTLYYMTKIYLFTKKHTGSVDFVTFA